MIARVAALALVILAGLAAQEARPSLEVVRAVHCDGGSTTRFAGDRVERNYREVAASLRRAISTFEKTAIATLEDGYDAGLPDPARRLRRTWRPPKPLPEQFRGITIHVVTVDQNGAVLGLPRGAPARADTVFISRAVRLKDCVRLAPVTLLTRDLATSLGIRSSRCRCTVSADGREIDITEGDQP